MKPKNEVNPYVELAEKEFRPWIFFSEEAKELRGQWSQRLKASSPLHIEIGTGNGFHFGNYVKAKPKQTVIGFEIKYKELVQTIRRAKKEEAENAWMIKADAREVSHIFTSGEVEKTMIHFPDPWPKRRHQKNRLMTKQFLKDLYKVSAANGVVEFKTDHFGYFQAATKEVAGTPWRLSYYTEHLHESHVADTNFVTLFEQIFLKKKQPIFYYELRK